MNQIMKKSYIKPVAEIHEEEDLKTAIAIKLKNGLGKMRKETWPIMIRFRTISKLKSPKLKSQLHLLMVRQTSVKGVSLEL